MRSKIFQFCEGSIPMNFVQEKTNDIDQTHFHFLEIAPRPPSQGPALIHIPASYSTVVTMKLFPRLHVLVSSSLKSYLI